MGIKERIDVDLKTALLAGDKQRTMTLRTLKSAILDGEIAANARQTGLAEDQLVQLLNKEVKKRTEAAALYRQGGSADRAAQEETEKAIITAYLPAQLDDQALEVLIQRAIEEVQPDGLRDMGKVIGLVKERSAGQADGSRIAGLVKEKLQ